MSKPSRSAMQDWTLELPLMQQSVLMSAIRGLDGAPKFHAIKPLLRWYRRCILVSAFDGKVITDPMDRGGGSFTGPSYPPDAECWSRPASTQWTTNRTGMPKPCWWDGAQHAADAFVTARDEMPLHYFVHALHAFQIVGFKHPEYIARVFWGGLYVRLVHALHLWPETVEQMDRRLGDNEGDWQARSDEAGSCSE